MTSLLYRLFLGRERTGYRRYLLVVLALAVFAASFAGYALDVFAVSGGVVWIPADAALVGIIAACWVGYARSGLVAAWLITSTSLLGYHADHAFFGLSHRSFAERVAYFVRPDGLVVLGVEGAVLGTVAFLIGYSGRRTVDWVRSGTAPN